MKGYKIILFLLITLSCFLQLNAQQPVVSAKLDSNNILIGDQVYFNLDVKLPRGVTITWPFLSDTLVNKVEILKVSGIDTLQSNSDFINLHQKILITSFDSGQYLIPPISFYMIGDEDTSMITSSTNSVLLNVNTIKVDTAKVIKPIKPPIGAPITFSEVLPWILGGLGVIGVIWFLIYYFRKKKRKEPIFTFKPKPKLPAHVIALKGLEELKHRKLWQNGRYKDYYTIMTDLIRNYIEERFNIQAVEMTSFEILQRLKRQKINQDIYNKIQQTLLLADLVKFAKEKPMHLENDISLNNSIDFVNETILKIEESMEENEKKETELIKLKIKNDQ